MLHKYPYSDLGDMNLDWMLEKIVELAESMKDFTVFNTITWCGEWNASQSYTKWNVVQDSNGNGYISIKAVPPNVNINNTDYWVLIANYSLLYSAWNTRISNLEYIVGDDDSGLVHEVNTLEDTVTDMLTEKPRRYIFISDSYGLGRNGTTSWTSYINTLISPAINNFYTYSEGSMGIARVGDGGHIAKTLLQAHSSEIQSHDTITDIIFGLGANDILATDTLSEEFTSLVTYVTSEYPNAKIWVGFIGNTLTKNTTTLNNYLTAINIYHASSATHSINYITDVEYIMHDATLMQSDNVHPTSEGSYELAKYVNAFLQGKPYTYMNSTLATYTSNTSAYTNNSVRTLINGNSISVIFGELYIETTNFTGRNDVKVGTLTNSVMCGIGGSVARTPCIIFAGNTYYSGSIFISGRDMYLEIPTTSTLTSGAGSVIVPDQIILNTLLS